MERILGIILAILPASALAVTPTAPPGFALGGSGSDALPSLSLSEYSMGYSSPYFTISAQRTASPADTCTPFQRDGANYQVTVGKVAQCYGPTYMATAASSYMQAVQATGTWSDGTCPTANPLYQGGASGRYVYPVQTGYVNYTRRDLVIFKSGYWPGAQYGGSTSSFSMSFLCREIQ